MTVRACSIAMMLVMVPTGCAREPAEQEQQRVEAPRVQEAVPEVQVANAVAMPAAPAPYVPRAEVPDLPENEAVSNDVVGAMPFPDEVTDFMVMRDGCDHFRGEEAYDSERRAFLTDKMQAMCTGTDAKLAVLRKRYAKDPDVMMALQGYEDGVE